MASGPKWGHNSGSLALGLQFCLLHPLCLSWKETGCKVYSTNIAIALLLLQGHLSQDRRLSGGRVPLSMWKRQRPAVPEMPLRPRGRSLEENFLPTSAWPWLPPNSLPAVSSREHHHVPGRAQPRAPAATTTGRSAWRPRHRVVITGHTHRWSFGNCYLSLQSGFVLCLLLSD